MAGLFPRLGCVGLGSFLLPAVNCFAIAPMPRRPVISHWCRSVHTAKLLPTGNRELNDGKIIKSSGDHKEVNWISARRIASAFRSRRKLLCGRNWIAAGRLLAKAVHVP